MKEVIKDSIVRKVRGGDEEKREKNERKTKAKGRGHASEGKEGPQVRTTTGQGTRKGF